MDVIEHVSIPYGKGKVAGGIAFAEWLLYQFPMGKVKCIKQKPQQQRHTVYQFPMGKVKNNI